MLRNDFFGGYFLGICVAERKGGHKCNQQEYFENLHISDQYQMAADISIGRLSTSLLMDRASSHDANSRSSSASTSPSPNVSRVASELKYVVMFSRISSAE